MFSINSNKGFTMIILLIVIVIIAILYFFGNGFWGGGEKQGPQNYNEIKKDSEILNNQVNERNKLIEEQLK